MATKVALICSKTRQVNNSVGVNEHDLVWKIFCLLFIQCRRLLFLWTNERSVIFNGTWNVLNARDCLWNNARNINFYKKHKDKTILLFESVLCVNMNIYYCCNLLLIIHKLTFRCVSILLMGFVSDVISPFTNVIQYFGNLFNLLGMILDRDYCNIWFVIW